MDGAPVRGETIPIRLFLGGFELTPTFRDVNKKFSARYYLNLVLIDEENRRYFKQNGACSSQTLALSLSLSTILTKDLADRWLHPLPPSPSLFPSGFAEITVFRIPEN